MRQLKIIASFLNDFPTSPYRTSAINSLVRLYRIRHKYTDAENLIRDEIRRKPDDINLMEQLADLYKAQGKYDEALSLYYTALDQNPKNTDILKKLGRAIRGAWSARSCSRAVGEDCPR